MSMDLGTIARLRHAAWAATLIAASLSVACTPAVKTAAPERSGDVDLGLITPEPSTRMQLGANQVFIAGKQTNPEVVPVYPPELLPLRLPDQVVCVKFVVNRDGSVSDAVPMYGAADCPAESEAPRQEFVTATLGAVSQWDFFSFQRCTFPPGTPDARKCKYPDATVEQVAVTLAYRFVFSAKDGAGTVRRSETGAAAQSR